MLRTAEQLTAVSRRLTAEHGLSGFTIDQLCEEVGIARRTFFNYFPAKEDAVIGADAEGEMERFTEEFLAKGSRGWNAVLDDLVEMISAQLEQSAIDPASHALLHAAIEREPKLLSRFLGAGRERERQAVELIQSRESVDSTDPRPEAVVSILTAILRTTGERYLDPDNTRTFGEILAGALDATRTVLQPRKAHA